MKRRLGPMALAAALAATSVVHAEPHRLVLEGQLESAGATRKVSLRVLCDGCEPVEQVGGPVEACHGLTNFSTRP